MKCKSESKTLLRTWLDTFIRASISQKRMTYIPEESKVIYESKDGKEEKVLDLLERLAAMCFQS